MRPLTARVVRSLIPVVAAACLAPPAAAQNVFTWVSGGGTWSNPGNWSPAVVPQGSPAATLIFAGRAGGYTSTNDLGQFQLNQLWAGPTAGAAITLASSAGG